MRSTPVVNTREVLMDKIHFILPYDEELIFPAVAMLQQYVNNYDARMENNDVSGGRVVHKLQYSIERIHRLWDVMLKAGLVLKHQPVLATDLPDMIIDFSDDRLEKFKNSGKHVCQVCGVMCGEEGRPLPMLKQIRPYSVVNGRWLRLKHGCEVSIVQTLTDNEWTGVIAHAGWETYLTASMGLAVIEIVPANRPRNWLSKFTNPGYRMIYEGPGQEHLIKDAMQSVEDWMRKCYSTQEVQPVGSQTPMDR